MRSAFIVVWLDSVRSGISLTSAKVLWFRQQQCKLWVHYCCFFENNNNNWDQDNQCSRLKANKHIVDTKNWGNYNVEIRIKWAIHYMALILIIELTASARLWDEPAIASLVDILHMGGFQYHLIELMTSKVHLDT
jgi:hypothetical protein